MLLAYLPHDGALRWRVASCEDLRRERDRGRAADTPVAIGGLSSRRCTHQNMDGDGSSRLSKGTGLNSDWPELATKAMIRPASARWDIVWLLTG